MSMTLSRERFAVIVDAYGADPRRWPSAERAAAEALAASDAEAGAWLAEARDLDGGLDAWLDALPVPAPASATLRRAVMPPVAPAATSRWQEFLALLGGWRLALPAMAAALVVGIGFGAGASRSGWAAVAAIETETASNTGSTLLSTGFAEALILDLEGRKP